MKNDCFLYLDDNKAQVGPFTWAQLNQKLKAGEITLTTPIARQGDTTWTDLSVYIEKLQAETQSPASAPAFATPTAPRSKSEYSFSMGPIATFHHVLRNYATFQGRATRQEFWLFTLVEVLLIVGLFVAFLISASDDSLIALSVILLLLICAVLLALIVPTIALTVRRLHDMGQTGWLYCINFIPYVGSIILLILCSFDSQRGTNQYGESLKYPD